MLGMVDVADDDTGGARAAHHVSNTTALLGRPGLLRRGRAGHPWDRPGVGRKTPVDA
jgi:hypothetical protein